MGIASIYLLNTHTASKRYLYTSDAIGRWLILLMAYTLKGRCPLLVGLKAGLVVQPWMFGI